MTINMAYEHYEEGRVEKAMEIIKKYVFSVLKNVKNLKTPGIKILNDFLMSNRNEKFVKQ